jgi:tRNA pseudouridine38-40 synthase
VTDPRAPRDKTTRTYRLVVAYLGTAFQGWQRQAGERSVQEVLETALSTLAGEPVRVRAAGRTDAGVHARGQAVSTTFSSRVAPEKLVVALGSQLPDDVSVLRADVMPDSFDAKRDSIGKRYVYRVHCAPWRDPFRAKTSWHVRQPLDVAAMQRAAQVFLGENDFESFRSVHCDAAHARRFLWRSHVSAPDETGMIEYEVRGNAFCRYMVRCLAGTLVDVGRGRFTVDDVARILAAKDRSQAGVTAPPEGLTLEVVYYADNVLGPNGADIPDGARFPGWPLGTAQDQ